MRKLSAIWLCLWYLAGCTHPAPIMHPHTDTSCNTAQADYNGTVKPILQQHCYSCHATATCNGGLNLEDTASLKKYLAYGFRGDGIYGSKFYHCISHAQNALPMPPTYKLDSCSLERIKTWLNAQAPI